MRTTKYYNFNNYEDLMQEGYEALTRALKTYKKGKGSIFSWIHRYVKTRVQRRANNHSTMRIPLKASKETLPYKEQHLPVLIEENYIPEKQYSLVEINYVINAAIDKLSAEQIDLIDKYFGLNSDAMNINEICAEKGINRICCKSKIKKAIKAIRKEIV